MESKLQQLCLSANGKRVVFDPIGSHTATHFNDSPDLRDIVRNLVIKMDLSEPLVAKDIKMGKIVGNSDVVKVDGSDEIVYAMRKNREDQGYVPFTKSRTSQPSRLISVYLVQIDDNTYE